MSVGLDAPMASFLDGFGSDASFRWTAAGVAVALLAAGIAFRFRDHPRLPPRPPKPPPQDVNAAFRALDSDGNMYRALIERDAADAAVPAPSPTELSAVLPQEVVEPHVVLAAGGPAFETRDLTISLRTGRVTARYSQGSVTRDHLILRVTNRGTRPLAYRIDTRLAMDVRYCVEKGEIPANAIAIAPGETVERTECAREGARTVTVDRVETIVLSPLGYFYVGRLFPAHTGLDPRVTRGHQPTRGAICADIPEQAIRRAQEKGTTTWRDVIDFYARHSCEKYIFPLDYKAFTRSGERSLPAVAGASQGRP